MKVLFNKIKSFFKKEYEYRLVSALDKNGVKCFYVQRRNKGEREWASFSKNTKVLSFSSIEKAYSVFKTFKPDVNSLKLVDFNAYFKPQLTF